MAGLVPRIRGLGTYKVYLGNITKANADVHGGKSFVQCVSLVILSNSPHFDRMSVVCMSVSACVCLYKYRHLYVPVYAER